MKFKISQDISTKMEMQGDAVHKETDIHLDVCLPLLQEQ